MGAWSDNFYTPWSPSPYPLETSLSNNYIVFDVKSRKM